MLAGRGIIGKNFMLAGRGTIGKTSCLQEEVHIFAFELSSLNSFLSVLDYFSSFLATSRMYVQISFNIYCHLE